MPATSGGAARAADGHPAGRTPARGAVPAQRSPTAGHAGERAAADVLDRHTIAVTLPQPLGTLRLPEPQRLAYYAGLGALAAFGIVDWPVAAVLGIGHLLAEDHNHRILAEFGQALSDALARAETPACGSAASAVLPPRLGRPSALALTWYKAGL